ncbi:SDR family oxidoreductase [Streptomyces sp. NPDC015127]|uniref:SDR family oxidoreductase n=1 Tax=Streptomyces sp. NPDC015127 TaxID=3364939 RepID=UPI0036FAFD7D
MTGATGFLGSHVLIRLLREQRDTDVVVLVRDDSRAASVRLRTALHATGVPVPEDLDARVRLVRADLGHARLGLDEGTYHELAEKAQAVWHMAGDIRLTARPEVLDRTNVQGTRHVLGLVGATRRPVPFFHTSTAYVAGRHSHGHVAEDELDDSAGFLTEYEGSKFRAEKIVRAFAEQRETPVTVFRPGVLVDDRVPAPGSPSSPHTVAAAGIARLGDMLTGPLAHRFSMPPGGVVVATMPGDPDAHMNVLPVQYAADAMIRAAEQPAVPGVTTYHVVHPRQTPIRSLVDALTHHAPWLRIHIGAAGGASHGVLEKLLNRMSGGIAAYGFLHRTYDRTRCAALGLADPPVLDSRYLRASFAPPARRSTLARLTC